MNKLRGQTDLHLAEMLIVLCNFANYFKGQKVTYTNKRVQEVRIHCAIETQYPGTGTLSCQKSVTLNLICCQNTVTQA